MDDILLAGTNLQWTDKCKTVEEIENITFPQIVKVTPVTTEAYNLPEKEPVMLYGRKKLVRIIAQTLEEGHYVIGKQIEIPHEFCGYFKLSHEFDREENQLRTFTSVQEIADYFPPKVYVQLDLTVMEPSSGDKPFPRPLICGDELTLISRSDVPSVINNAAKPASRFINRVIPKLNQQSVLIVHCTRINESISLPLNLVGHFATRSPFEIHQSAQSREMTVYDIIEKVNFPTTVLVSLNQTRSPKDEFVLRPGMHLKLIGAEFHDIVLAVTPFQRITEFAATGTTFILPQAVVNPQANEKDTTSYHTFKQNAYMNTQLQGSISNIDNYTKSVRFYINRGNRPTKPQYLPPLASERIRHLDPSFFNPQKMNRAMSAIALISRGSDPPLPTTRSVTRNVNSIRRSLPTPGLPPPLGDGPPLPPRNSAGSVKRPHVPPKDRTPPVLVLDSDIPQRPPPTPNGFIESSSASSQKEPISNRSSREINEMWSPLATNTQENIYAQKGESNDYGESTKVENNNDEIWDDISNHNSVVSSVSESSGELEIESTDYTPTNNKQTNNENLDSLTVNSLLNRNETSNLIKFDSNTSINSASTNDEMKMRNILKQHLFEKKYVLPEERWKPSCEVSEMTVNEIMMSLRYIGFSEEVVQVFYNERVDGSLFVDLSDEILEQDFYLTKFYIHKIRRFIAGWRPKLTQAVDV